eukprot:TRINITY_DN3849_c2_g1_i1.p3 TRINITY_DN3849_c2_g1~~TRINITY_DN3849_c2_g1_i1.p3  ORF type:complete len:211 (+),score=35.99 TRINITY_DN3849_c2_g1_i1:2282-2914(+)
MKFFLRLLRERIPVQQRQLQLMVHQQPEQIGEDRYHRSQEPQFFSSQPSKREREETLEREMRGRSRERRGSSRTREAEVGPGLRERSREMYDRERSRGRGEEYEMGQGYTRGRGGGEEYEMGQGYARVRRGGEESEMGQGYDQGQGYGYGQGQGQRDERDWYMRARDREQGDLYRRRIEVRRGKHPRDMRKRSRSDRSRERDYGGHRKYY